MTSNVTQPTPQKENMRQTFLTATIFRAISAGCIVIACILSLFVPFYTVELQNEPEEDYVLDVYDVEEKVSFSLFDCLTDLKGEFDLYNEYKEDVDEINEKMEDGKLDSSKGYKLINELKLYYAAPEDSGKFSAAMTTYITNLRAIHEPSANEFRFEIFIWYTLILIIPAIFIVFLLISAITGIIQTIILALKPSTTPKPVGASIIISAILGHSAAIFLLGFLTKGYAASYATLIPLVVFFIAGIVFDKLYCSTTKRIVANQFKQ